jgi:hypothetical protein
MSSWHVVLDEWKPRLRAYLRATFGEERDRLSAQDFRANQSVHLQFDDGSFALFRYAFAILEESGKRCMVFTEHCGYHMFPVGPGGVHVMHAAPLGPRQAAEQGPPQSRDG